LSTSRARSAARAAGVLLVHHTGHGQVERERGSYALVAAADCRLQATYEEATRALELRWHKLKDDERPEPLVFGWKSVGLEWEDADGDELSSVVLERLVGGAPTPNPAGLGKNQDKALTVLRTLYARARKNLEEQGRDPSEAKILTSGWRAALESNLAKPRFYEALDGLKSRGLVLIDGAVVHLSKGAE